MSTPEVRWVATAAEIRAAEAEPLAREGEAALMDRAAAAVADAAAGLLAERNIDAAGTRAVLLVGTGNNGGDALLAGALLAAAGATVTALQVGDTAHPRGLAALREAGGAVISRVAATGVGASSAAALLADANLVIDGIVGLGATAGLREPAASLVAAIPASVTVLAVDLPSGLDADSGLADSGATGSVRSRSADLGSVDSGSPAHVTAHATVSFTAPTACVLLPPAALAAGRVTFADVGVPIPPRKPGAPARLTDAGIAARWPVPEAGDNKYSRGVVGIVAGSEAYPGAAILACTAAIRSGAGLVRFVGPRRAQDLVLAARPEVVAADPSLPLPRVDAWVLGPGVADDPDQEAAILAAVASGVPCVVDAGGIMPVVLARALEGPGASGLLLTPHAGELARALAGIGSTISADEIARDPAAAARTLAEATRATVLLKGAVTLVASPSGTLWSQADGPAWLATAGAGDVLAGIAGALLAAGLPADEAGAVAASVHGRAARLVSGGGPIAALDIASALAAIVASLGSSIGDLLREGGRAT
ncbi:MAG TPA: NAD(P)H-hydrate dehydratase [Demequinaceae bacterium]